MWTEIRYPWSKWKVSFVDGYVQPDSYAGPRPQVLQCPSLHNARVEKALVHEAGRAKWDFHKRKSQEFKLRYLCAELLRTEFSPQCDLYVVRLPKRSAHKPVSLAGAVFARENDSSDLRYLIQMKMDCPFYRECLLEVMDRINFQPKPETSYRDAYTLIDTFRQLVPDLLEDHPSPEPIVEKRLAEHGIRAIHAPVPPL